MGELKKLRIAGTENTVTPYTAADDTVVITNHTVKVNTNKIATKTDLDGKVDKETGKGLSTNDFTTAEKNKLAGIEAQANKTVVDDELSDQSENPVQNKVITGKIGDLKAEINHLSVGKADIIISNASGAIASFTDGADGLPMESVVAHIEPVQSGTGDPSPTNVRPISGWTQAKVIRTGKNLIQNKKVIAGNSIYFGVDTLPTSPSSACSIILPAGTYTFSVETADGTDTNLYVAKVDVVDYFVRVLNGKSLTFSISETTALRLWVYKAGYSTVGVGAITQFQLECGSTATDYEPYQGETFTIDLDGTIYGGTVDLVSGKLLVDSVKKKLSDLSWTMNTSDGNTVFYSTVNDKINDATNYLTSDTFNPIMDTASSLGGARNKLSDYTCIASKDSSRPYIYLKANDASSADDLVTKYGNAEFIYELATPITYDLTPQEITSLLGVNNVWSDTGDTDVTYRADTKLYLESHMPEIPVEDVQVNGTSVVNQGVANVPVADDTTIGVAKFGATYGVAIGSGGQAYVSQATSAQAKAGTAGFRPIAPERQHESTFYGLAKAAGSDEKNSSLAVGQYTDAAKIAIQKMLGIYEPPFELLNDITLDAEGGIDLTADSNGTPYNLLGVFIYVFYPANTPTATGGYGRYRVYDSNNRYCNSETGKYTTATSGKYKYISLDRRNNLALLNYTVQQPTGNSSAWYIKTVGTTINETLLSNNGGALLNLGNIVRIAMPSGDVEPERTRIQIYGQRAY